MALPQPKSAIVREYPRWITQDLIEQHLQPKHETKREKEVRLLKEAEQQWPNLQDIFLNTSNLDFHKRTIVQASNGTLKQSGVRYTRYFTNLPDYNRSAAIDCCICIEGFPQFDVCVGKAFKYSPAMSAVQLHDPERKPLLQSTFSFSDFGMRQLLTALDRLVVEAQQTSDNNNNTHTH